MILVRLSSIVPCRRSSARPPSTRSGPPGPRPTRRASGSWTPHSTSSPTGLSTARPRGRSRRSAGVSQPSLAYHFHSKDELWRAAVSPLFGELEASVRARLDGLRGVDQVTTAKLLVREFITFSAAHPQLHRIITQESKVEGERIDWLVDEHVRPLYDVTITMFEDLAQRRRHRRRARAVPLLHPHRGRSDDLRPRTGVQAPRRLRPPAARRGPDARRRRRRPALRKRLTRTPTRHPSPVGWSVAQSISRSVGRTGRGSGSGRARGSPFGGRSARPSRTPAATRSVRPARTPDW